MSATPQFRYPRPDQPDAPIVWVTWPISSHTEMDTGVASPLAAEWWDEATEDERESALEVLRVQAARAVSKRAGRSIGVGEVSYTIHRGDEAPVRPDEEPTT
jgi:hypothetical protein